MKIRNTKCWPLISIPPPSFLCRPNPSTLTWQQMAPARVHFCVDSWTLHLQIILKHSPRNHQAMKVLQARVPLDFVLHCSNRLRPHRLSCLSFKHRETLTFMHIFRSLANICCCVPSYNDQFCTWGQNWDPFGAYWMHWPSATGYHLTSPSRTDRDLESGKQSN